MTKGNVKQTRISYEQAAEVLGLKQRHLLARTLCNWSLDEEAPGFFRIHARIKPVLFVPVAAVELLASIPLAAWDGGLRTLELPTREIRCDTFFGCDPHGTSGETYADTLGRLGVVVA